MSDAPFKDAINRDVIQQLAAELSAVGEVDAPAFVDAAVTGLEALELKDRVRQVASALRAHLAPRYPAAVAHILRALPPPHSGTDGVSAGFRYWPYAHFVEDYGGEHFATSVRAMREITQRFSAEFAVRPFIAREPQRTIAWLTEQLEHPSVHVRRWVSEGTRPRLPWGMRLQALVEDPSPTLPLLEALKDDPEEYVRRSVANHLNDIAKDHPDVVVKVAKEWWRDGDEDRRRLVRHALRTLVKQGHPGALGVLGFSAPKADLVRWHADDEVVLGGALQLEAVLRSTSKKKQRLLVDFAIHHQKANGTTAPKVFKWTERELAPGETVTLTKSHAMRPVTTRRYYPGAHAAELLVNGRSLGRVSFDLRVP